MATGHYLGDTGDFSNTIYTGYSRCRRGDSRRPSSRTTRCWATSTTISTATTSTRTTILKIARDEGFSTAAIGKLGPTLIFDHTERTGKTIDRDRRCHRRHERRSAVRRDEAGADQRPACRCRRRRAATTARRANAKTRHDVANVAQQDYFADVATKVVLPMFKARNKPFVMVYWSRDPDGCAAQPRRQPQQHRAGHQRPDLARRHQERRRQSGAPARRAGRARPRRNDRHHRHLRPRLLDDLEGKRDQPVGEEPYDDAPKDVPADGLPRPRPRPRAAPACTIPTTRTPRSPTTPIRSPATA